MVVDVTVGSSTTVLRHCFPLVSSLDPTEMRRLLGEASNAWGKGYVVAHYAQGRRLAVGANFQSSSPLYLRLSQGENAITLTDRAPRVAQINDLSRDACLRFLSYPYSCGPFEVAVWKEAFHKAWLKVPPGFILYIDEFDVATLCPLPIEPSPVRIEKTDPRGVLDIFRTATSQLGERGKVAVEFSGGIDSGIVYTQCLDLLGERFLGGISYDFDYYEFRREKLFRAAIYGRNSHLVHKVQQEFALAFFAIEKIPYFPEPSINSTSWSMFDQTLKKAEHIGASTLLNGHGGDLVFLVDPCSPILPKPAQVLPEWFPGATDSVLRACADEVLRHLNWHVDEGIGGYWHPSMLHPATLTNFAERFYPGVEYKSGIISKEFYYACMTLWRTFENTTAAVQKPFAYTIFQQTLPEQVWHRPSKVNHLANVFRGAARSRNSLVALFDDNHELAELLGFSGKKLSHHIREFVSGVDSGNPMTSQLIALFSWWKHSTECHG